ncbi:MAG: hypothetical protein NZ518_03590 [Dehalococcoidia bacterium]|nr:hypothetical protein [Dehalococcoidia bacterium]
MQSDPIPASPSTPDVAFHEAMQFIKDGRWTEAKRKLAEVAAIDPTYRNVGQVQAMVEEVLQTSFFGVGIPAHLQARIPHRDAPPPAPEDDEDDRATATVSRPRVNPVVVVGILLVVVVVAVVLVVTRR